MTADELRSLFANPQAYVFQLARAIITKDTDTQTVLFGQIAEGRRWPGVAVVALCELAQELTEHRGDGALAWLNTRLQIGLDDPDPA